MNEFSMVKYEFFLKWLRIWLCKWVFYGKVWDALMNDSVNEFSMVQYDKSSPESGKDRPILCLVQPGNITTNSKQIISNYFR